VGVATDHTLTAFLDLNLGRAASSAIGGANEVSTVNRIIEQVGFIPGVRAAGLATSLPPALSRMRVSFALPSAADGVRKDYLADLVPITSRYFRTVGVPLLRGRGFADADNAAGPEVAIVSASTARTLFGDGGAVGRQLPAGLEGDPVTIVGVVADVKYSGLAAGAPLAVYVPYSQRPFRAVHLFVRVDGDPVAVTPNIRRAVASVDPRIAIVEVRSLADVVNAATAQLRLRTIIFVALASLALLLAAVGLSGVVAYSVSQRTREIGIRIALGASAQDVVRMVLSNATRLSVAGVVLRSTSLDVHLASFTSRNAFARTRARWMPMSSRPSATAPMTNIASWGLVRSKAAAVTVSAA
jgi:putative ABC transport system permease protein